MNLELEIAQKLTNYRKAHSISQEKMAERCGLSLRHYNDIEHGKANIKLTTFANIVSVLNQSATEFADEFWVNAAHSVKYIAFYDDYSCDGVQYSSCGIKAVQSDNVILKTDDISQNYDKVNNMARLLNLGKVDPIHMNEVIIDLLG